MPIDPRDLDAVLGNEKPSSLPPMCPECGYNLTGATSNRCTECGHVFLQRELEKGTNLLRERLVKAQNAAEMVTLGFRASLLGIGLLLLGLILGGLEGLEICFAKICAFVCGLIALCLGLCYFHYLRIPIDSRNLVKTQPNFYVAVSAITLGALLVLVCLLRWS